MNQCHWTFKVENDNKFKYLKNIEGYIFTSTVATTWIYPSNAKYSSAHHAWCYIDIDSFVLTLAYFFTDVSYICLFKDWWVFSTVTHTAPSTNLSVVACWHYWLKKWEFSTTYTLKFVLMSKDVKGRKVVSSTGRQTALVFFVKGIGFVSSKIATSYSSVLLLK